MNRIIFTFLSALFLLVCFVQDGRTQTSVPTNIDIMVQLTDAWANDVLDEIPIGSDSVLYLISPKNMDDMGLFIQDRFVQKAAEKKIFVYAASDSSEKRNRVAILIQKAGILYERIERDGFLGSRTWIWRKGEIQLALQFFHKEDGRIQHYGVTAREISDRFPTSQISVIEQGGRLLGHPPRPESKGAWRWIEPAVVLGVLGSVAYLFYSVRSR